MAKDAAIGKLVDGHRQFLSFVQRHVESRAAAEDILQSAFVKSLERSGELQNDESAVAWFYRILRNAIVDHYRHRAATERATGALARESEAWSQPSFTKEEVCACLMPVLATLKPEYRQALELVDVNDASLNELAAQAGITSGNAAVRIHRAREAFRKQVRIACGTCSEHGCLDCRCKAGGSNGPPTATAQ